jgi:hypothetical protein
MIIEYLSHARRGLLLWDRRRIIAAVVAGLAAAGLVGVATVLIPNRLFARDVPPEWWDYPVWILMSVLIGMLVATCLRDPAEAATPEPTTDPAPAVTESETSRTGLVGSLGGIVGWFAVGCPVCNKIALLMLGYTGALTYFAPLQPILAAISLVLLAAAVVIRLKGQYACPVPTRERTVRS